MDHRSSSTSGWTSSNPRGRTLGVVVASAACALGLWTMSAAVHWRGDPADHAGGRWIAAALVGLALVVVAGIARLCIERGTLSLSVVVVAAMCWTAARLVMTSLFPAISDEAYHWLWAQRLDLCYYDHPGMVAWLARLATPGAAESTA